MIVLIKVHEHYRKVVAVCDPELVGKKFEQDNLQLNVSEFFYQGKEYNEEKALKFLEAARQDDACFNFVGKNAIELGAKAGVISKKCVLIVQGVPHALGLL